ARAPAAERAQAMQYGGLCGPSGWTRQSMQNSPPQTRQLATASSNRCFSHVLAAMRDPHARGPRPCGLGVLSARGGTVLIARYSLPEMSGLWSDEARLERWLEVEVLAVEAWAAIGRIPEDDAKAVRARAPVVTPELVEAVRRREEVTDHDLAAFVDVIQDAIGPPEASWVHFGLTSSDVVDTALSATLVRSADLLVEAASALVGALRERAFEFQHTPMVGRTHGMHAEPTTFGVKLALWCLQADRDRQRLQAARQAVAVGRSEEHTSELQSR